MTNVADYVVVEGDFLLDTSAYAYNIYGSMHYYTAFSAGTLEVRGDFSQLNTGNNAWYQRNFYSEGTHKVILSGSRKQAVYFRNPTYNYSHFNILEITNSSAEGVELASRVIVTGELVATQTPVIHSELLSLSGNGLLSHGNWPHDLVIDQYSGGWTLQQDQVIGKNLELKDNTLDLNGKTLTVEGDLIHSNGMLKVSGGKLIVKGDYILAQPKADGSGYSTGSGGLYMTNAGDYVLVEGDFLLDTKAYTYNVYGSYQYYAAFTAGTLEVRGDFSQKNSLGSSVYSRNFYSEGTHKVLLSGNHKQTVHFQNPASNYSHFNILEITNSSDEGIEFNSSVAVSSLFEHNRLVFVLANTANSNFVDYDGDGLTDNIDPYPQDKTNTSPDSDGDGISDDQDIFPNDKTEWEDIDHDGVGDNADLDDDDDGMPDAWEALYGLNRLNKADADLDKDNDGFTNKQEYDANTDPTDATDYPITAQITSVTVLPNPINAGALVTVTVTGSDLPGTLGLALDTCNGLQKLSGGSATQVKYQCTFPNAGTFSGTVKDKPNGKSLHTFSATVQAALPDLQVTGVSLAANSIPASQTRMATVTVKNAGQGLAGASTLTLKLSADSIPNNADDVLLLTRK